MTAILNRDPGDECDRCPDELDRWTAVYDTVLGPVDTHSVHVDLMVERRRRLARAERRLGLPPTPPRERG